ncbi:MAG: oxidoreductase [Bacteroidia bacterium]|nr:oxidoreductase [Bacteroidia bacterium]
MKRMHFLSLILVWTAWSCHSFNLKWETLTPPAREHLRGLSPVSGEICWASGMNGTVLRTLDGGQNWEISVISQADSMDLRDIEGLDEQTALAITAGSPGQIFRTADGGKSWNLVYRDTNPAIFFDGMDFWDAQHGLAFGDPIDGRFVILLTEDGGLSWKEIPGPEALAGEGGFAASGTSIATAGSSSVWIGTGLGETSRVLRSTDRGKSWTAFATTVKTGEGCGIFSLAFWNENEGVAVGGCYGDSANANANCALTRDGGQTWTLVKEKNPRGYRSCVTSNGDGSLLICSGRTGMDYSTDQGKSWLPMEELGYYACALTAGNVAWASGRKGRLAKLSQP